MAKQPSSGDEPAIDKLPEASAKSASQSNRANERNNQAEANEVDAPVAGSGKQVPPGQRPPSRTSHYKPTPVDPNLKWVLPLVAVVMALTVVSVASKPVLLTRPKTSVHAGPVNAPVQRQPSAEDRAAQAKAERDRQKALEQQNRVKIAGLLADIKTVPERLYEVHLSLWQELTTLAPANPTYAAGRQKAADALASVKDATENPEVFGASIERSVATKAGFGNVLVVDLTIRNDSLSNLKDFQITCSVLGNSGTEMGTVARVMYETVEARSSRTIRHFNMGFVDPQARSAQCMVARSSIG